MNDDSIVHRLTSLDGSPLPVAKLTPLVMSPPKKGNTWTCVTWLFLHRIAHRSDYKWQMNRPTVRNRIWQFTAQKRRHRRLPAPLSPVWTNQSCRFVSSSTTYYYYYSFFLSACHSVLWFCRVTHFLLGLIVDPRLAYGVGNDAETASGHRWG
jgi:hypothetical protein